MTARPTLDLDKLSYKHRFVSKGNSLRDASVVSEQAQKKNRTYVPGEKRGEVVDVGRRLGAAAVPGALRWANAGLRVAVTSPNRRRPGPQAREGRKG
jgi:hypothetical protein